MPTPQQPLAIEGLTPEAAASVIRLNKTLANSADIEDRIQFYSLLKKADPKTVIPTDIQMEQFRRELKTNDEARNIEQRRTEAVAKQERQKRDLIESGRYDELTVKRIEDEIMTPQGISDYGIAATLFAAQNPEPNVSLPERTGQGATWQMPWEGGEKDKVRRLIANPRKVAVERAHQAVADLRNKRKA